VAGGQDQDPNQEEMEIEKDLEEVQPNLPSPLIFKGDESDLVADDRLVQYHLSLNKAFGMLLCHHADCGIALEGNWWNHTNAHRKRQQQQPLTQADKDAVKEILDTHRGAHFAPTANMVPVQGLLLHTGHVCLTCEPEEAHGASTLDALRRHNYKEHTGHPFRHEPGFYQTLAKTGAARFRVNTSMPPFNQYHSYSSLPLRASFTQVHPPALDHDAAQPPVVVFPQALLAAKLTKEQYLAFVGGKPLEQIVQEEKDTLLATITARKVADFTGMFPITCHVDPCPFIHPSSPFTCSFQADQVSHL